MRNSMAHRAAMAASTPTPFLERVVDSASSPGALASWAGEAAGRLAVGLEPDVVQRVRYVARVLADDALARELPPVTLRVAVTPTAVEVSVTGARSVPHRVAQDHHAPGFAQARRMTTGWTVRRGPDGHGSTLTATVALKPRRAWRERLHTRRGGRR